MPSTGSFTTESAASTTSTASLASSGARRSRRLLAGLALAAVAQLLPGCGAEQDTGAPGQGDVTATEGALSLSKTGLTLGDVTRPPISLRLMSDLKPDGTMRFYASDASTIGVQINVTNVGNQPAFGPAGTVIVNGYQVDGSLYQYWGGTSTTANAVNPGERGYIMIHIPNWVIKACGRYPVHIDVGHNMQAGLPDPYANDEATVSTQCLAWDSTITTNNYPFSGPPVDGKSIFRIVSSFAVGRPDGQLCSHCHFATSSRAYSPPVAQDSSAAITAGQVIGGLTWDQNGGWAERFTHQPTDTSFGSKPFILKQLLQTWLDDGRNPGSFLRQTVLTTEPTSILVR